MTELDKRVTWLKDETAAGRMPDVDLYACDCGTWTMAIAGVPEVRCQCGATPTYLRTVRRPVAIVTCRGA